MLGEAESPLATLASDGKGDLVNAIELLKKDHRTFEKLCAELESTTERAVKTRKELFARLKDELVPE